MGRALAEHDRMIRQSITAHGGHVFATAGDSVAAAFHGVGEAVSAAVEAQRGLSDLAVDGEPLRVRMGIHMGEAEERGRDYFGPVLNRCGRLRDAAHGGQVLASGKVREHLTRDGANDIDWIALGQYRLRDLEKAEEIFQAAHPELQATFPPLRALTKATTNFPVQLTSFVGREQELAEVAKLVRGARLVTVTGVGGSGKTRLAMQVAAGIASEFADGVWLVDLAPVSEPDLAVDQVAAVLGVSETANRSLPKSLIDHLRTRRTLLILDNCEHLIDAARKVVAAVLSGTQGVSIIATSRESLHIPGEVGYAVPPLGIPPAGDPLDLRAVGRFDAVRLFVNRAESARAGFRLTNDTAGAVLEICRRLDGIPLAIELAAARLASFAPQQIAGHLDQRFRLLSGGRQDGVPRQETLQATIDWSYALLSEIERLLFLRLAVFRGDFSLEASQAIVAVAGIDEMDLLEVLPRLIDKSLVVAEPVRGEMRYRLLETIRQYASDRWEPTGERPLLQDRHAAHFLQVAEDGSANLRTAKHEEVLDRLRVEHDNMRQALRWSLDADAIDTGLRLAGALYRFWLYNDNESEGSWWLRELLSRGQPVADAVRAKALLGLGSLSGNLVGQGRSGTTALEEAVDIYRRLNGEVSTRLDYATALNNLGADLVTMGEFAGAESCYEEALEISRALDLPWGVALVLGNLGRLSALDGRTDQARSFFDQGVDQARRLGSPRMLGDALSGKATFERDFGIVEDSVKPYLETIAVYQGADHSSAAQLAGAQLAVASIRLGMVDDALRRFLPNAAACLDQEEMLMQAGVVIELALGRAEIDIAVGSIDRAAALLGFVDSLVELGGYDDFLPRVHRVRAAAEKRMEQGRFGAAAARGRTISIESARELIVAELSVDDEPPARAIPLSGSGKVGTKASSPR
jgi:predicted ATPase